MDKTFYDITIEKYTDAGRRLSAYAKELETLPVGSITKRQKKSGTYYYLNAREGDKVKTLYIGNEAEMSEVRTKLLERKEIESSMSEIIEVRKACEYCLGYKGWAEKDAYNFSLYYGKILVADVFTHGEVVDIKRYEDNPGMQLFYSDKITRFELGQILQSRCWDEDRVNLANYLKKLHLNEYNVYEICRLTHGIMLQDAFWFKFLGEKFDGTKVLKKYGFA